MKIFVSAAEISSDLQAEKVIRSLLALMPEQEVECYGIAGPKLRALPKFRAIQNAEELRAMGFAEVLGKLSTIKKIIHQTVLELEKNPPDLIITFDYPDFHFQLLKRIHGNHKFENTLKICGIPPKLWVWRQKRVEKIRKFYHGVWTILPFEKEFYEDHGIPVIYEGNPLIADLLNSAKKITKNEQSSSEFCMAVMPGSREAELKYHLPVIPETLEKISKHLGKKVLAQVPVPEGLSISRFENFLKPTERVRYEFIFNGSTQVLAQNQIGLIKSGTSTLEAAVLGCIPIIFYRAHFTTTFIFKLLIRYGGPVGLPNILLRIKKREDSVFPEILGPEATPDKLAETFLSILKDDGRIEYLRKQGEKLRSSLVPNANVSEAVAKKILIWSKQMPLRSLDRKNRFLFSFISFIWSLVNFFRRKTSAFGFIPARNISLPSVLVGNLQAGGAGKTPMVIEIAREAVKRGFQVGVISRGYGRESKEDQIIDPKTFRSLDMKIAAKKMGDEPLEICLEVPQVTLALGSDRYSLVELLKKRGINFVIFDDGFQNLKFKPSLTVLAITDAKPSQVIYRDFKCAAQSADLLIQSKGFKKPEGISLDHRLQWTFDGAPTQQPLWLLCGVADPNEVVQFYQNVGFRFDRVISLPDHFAYQPEWVKKLMLEARSEGASIAVTPKDKTKLLGTEFSDILVLRRRIANRDWLDSVFERLQSSNRHSKL